MGHYSSRDALNVNVTGEDSSFLWRFFKENLELYDGAALRAMIGKYSPTEIVEVLGDLEKDLRERFFSSLLTPEVLVLLPDDLKLEVIELIDLDFCAQVLNYVSAVKIYMFIESLSDDLRIAFLCRIHSSNRVVIEELLSYPEDSAGRLIGKDYVLLPSNLKVGQVIDMLSNHRRNHNFRDMHYLFVVDSFLRPIGVVSASDLLYAPRESKISSIMSANFKSIQSGADQQEVIRVFRNYSLFSLAVLNEAGSITGVIYADDVIDVVQEEADEDLACFGGVAESDINYRIWHTSIKRVVWLLVSFIAINCASLVVSLFNDVLDRSVELVALMPVIAAMGGNAGLQASTVSVRSLISNELRDYKALILLRKELIIGLINGLILSSAMFIIIMFRFDDIVIAFSFSISMVTLFTMATVAGAATPLFLDKIGLDPCLASSVIISAVTDILAVYLLLEVAKHILP